VRIAGWILLLAGLALCLSIAWAPIGFLLMGVGLVALQVAEQNRRRARLALVAGSGSVDQPPAAVTTPRTEEPVVQRATAPAPARRATRRFNPDRPPYDREAWRRLIESDPDLAQLTEVLSDFGQQYVDELATSYLADPDKSRLGAIVDGIIAKAGRANALPAANPSDDSKPAAAFKPAATSEPAAASSPDTEISSSHSEVSIGLSPTNPPAIEVEAPPSETIVATPAPPAIDPPLVEPPRPDRERRDIPITTVDDDLTEMIKKFAPDSNFLRRN
jgi:hypothetical protein